LELKYKRGYESVNVLAAKQYIDQGIIIDESMVEEKRVPKAFVQPLAISSVKELINNEGKKAFMTIVPVEKGEQVIKTKLFMLGLETGLSSVIPSGKRAVTLACDRGDTMGILKPGNRVDVIGVFDNEDKTILQNILVLSVGNSFFGTDSLNGITKPAPALSEQAEGRIPVSLAVTPSEAGFLLLAAEKGVIKFSLRGMGDDKPAELENVKLQDILGAGKTSGKNAEAEAYVTEMKKKIILNGKYNRDLPGLGRK
jgi:pilus assembly protein CpaB